MPKVWHLPLEEAKAELAAAGITYRVSQSQSRIVPEGDLISVSPLPGTPMVDGLEAILNISYGPPRRPT